MLSQFISYHRTVKTIESTCVKYNIDINKYTVKKCLNHNNISRIDSMINDQFNFMFTSISAVDASKCNRLILDSITKNVERLCLNIFAYTDAICLLYRRTSKVVMFDDYIKMPYSIKKILDKLYNTVHMLLTRVRAFNVPMNLKDACIQKCIEMSCQNLDFTDAIFENVPRSVSELLSQQLDSNMKYSIMCDTNHAYDIIYNLMEDPNSILISNNKVQIIRTISRHI